MMRLIKIKDWGEKCAAIKLLHIRKAVFQSITKDFPLNKSEHDHHYYVDILHNPTDILKHLEEFNVVNLDDNPNVL